MPAASDKLSREELTAVGKVVDEKGLVAAAKTLGVGREALARVMARLPVHRGTILSIRVALEASS